MKTKKKTTTTKEKLTKTKRKMKTKKRVLGARHVSDSAPGLSLWDQNQRQIDLKI
jgi:hypothetical protein